MRDASVAAWMQDLAEAYQIGSVIGNKVILISCSTGGTGGRRHGQRYVF